MSALAWHTLGALAWEYTITAILQSSTFPDPSSKTAPVPHAGKKKYSPDSEKCCLVQIYIMAQYYSMSAREAKENK